MSDTYELRVQGHLDDRWSESEWLGGLAMRRQEAGTTVLAGPIVDQAGLHGVINRIRDLGLPLLSVQRTDPSQQAFTFEPVAGGTRLGMVLALANPELAAPARQQWDNDLLVLKQLLEARA